MPNYQGVWNISTQYQNRDGWPSPPVLGFFAGNIGVPSNYINKINIASLGNATDVGDLTQTRRFGAGAASTTRGVFACGYYYDTGTASDVRPNIIDYITMASAGNATDFGDHIASVTYCGGASNSTRALFCGGTPDGSTQVNSIGYITIATTGNATSFGSLIAAESNMSGCASPTRAVFGGGYNLGSSVNRIQYNTIASTGNSTDFGDLTAARFLLGGGAASSTRALFAGGYGSGTFNTIDYVTIATTGNAADFGDLTVARRQLGACSDSHGGLG